MPWRYHFQSIQNSGGKAFCGEDDDLGLGKLPLEPMIRQGIDALAFPIREAEVLTFLLRPRMPYETDRNFGSTSDIAV